jgi:hypothetical protein
MYFFVSHNFLTAKENTYGSKATIVPTNGYKSTFLIFVDTAFFQ